MEYNIVNYRPLDGEPSPKHKSPKIPKEDSKLAEMRGSEYFSEATRVLEKRREVMEIQSSLEQKKVEFQESLSDIKKREVLLQMEKRRFEMKMKEHERFVSENTTKFKRALKKEEEERKGRSEKLEELKQRSQECLDLEKERKAILKKLKKSSRYLKYLEDVVSYRQSTFQEVKDIRQRYDTLVNYADDHQVKLKQLKTDLDESQQRCRRELAELESDKIMLTNLLAQRAHQLERSTLRNFELTMAEDHRFQRAANLDAMLSTFRLAVDSIYERCTTSGLRKSIVPVDSVNDRLSFIGEFLTDLVDLCSPEISMPALRAAVAAVKEHMSGDLLTPVRDFKECIQELCTVRPDASMFTASAYLIQRYVERNPYTFDKRLGMDYSESDDSSYCHVHRHYHLLFRRALIDNGFDDIVLFDSYGWMMYSVSKADDFLTNFLWGLHKDSGLGKVFHDCKAKPFRDNVVFHDFSLYSPAGQNALAAFIGCPIITDDGTFEGCMAIRVSPQFASTLKKTGAKGRPLPRHAIPPPAPSLDVRRKALTTASSTQSSSLESSSL